MTESGFSRRGFFAAGAAALALGVLAGCGGGGSRAGTVEVFALSGRGRRISRAAKKHNANKRFLTSALADRHRAHPGDTSRVVRLLVSREEFQRLFGSGQVVRDLRHI